MVTPGGEVAFVNRIIAESVKLRDQVQWYSSMVGKSQSIPALVQSIKDAGITNWAVTQFVQGNKTRRWALAWSWGDLRPRMVSLSQLSGLIEVGTTTE
jgi:23S rRNA (adenine1618-N6)-methyltransferase